MTNKELKQRLSELVMAARAPLTSNPIAEKIADHLIANGVTIRQHGEWIGISGVKGIYDDFYCSFCKQFTEERNPNRLGDFCSFCGSDMRG